MSVDVELVDLVEGYVLAEGSQILPITNYYDDCGDECDPEDAVAVVAGNDDYGWLSIELAGPAPRLN